MDTSYSSSSGGSVFTLPGTLRQLVSRLATFQDKPLVPQWRLMIGNRLPQKSINYQPPRKSPEVRRPQQHRGVGLASRNHASVNYVVQLLQKYINVTFAEVAALLPFMFVQRPRLGCLQLRVKMCIGNWSCEYRVSDKPNGRYSQL